MIRMTIGTKGGKEIDGYLGRTANRSSDFRPLWNELEEYLLKLQRTTFKGKGAGSSAQFYNIPASQSLPKWKPLKKATVTAKRRAGYSSVATYPLIRTGRLRNAFTNKKGTKDSIRVKQPLVFAFGIKEGMEASGDFQYPSIHDVGGPIMPQRRLFRLPKNMRRIVRSAMGKFIIEHQESVRVVLEK